MKTEKWKLLIAGITSGLCCLTAVAGAGAESKTLFYDAFDLKEMNASWQVKDGKWRIEDGYLTCDGAGNIRLAMEFGGGWIFSCRIREREIAKGCSEISFLFRERPGVYCSVMPRPEGAVSVRKGGDCIFWQWQERSEPVKEVFNLPVEKVKFKYNEWHAFKIVFTDDALLQIWWDNKLLKNAPAELRPISAEICGSKYAALDIDEVKVVPYELPERETVFADEFQDLTAWKTACQRNGEEVADIAGNTLKPAADGWVCLNYEFGTDFEDSVYITRETNIGAGTVLSLDVDGDNSGHQLFAVLMDSDGESHFVLLPAITWQGRKTIRQNIAGLANQPDAPGARSAIHWGGDGNQVLEYPIRAVTVGVSDKTDQFTGRGSIGLKNVRLLKTKGPASR